MPFALYLGDTDREENALVIFALSSPLPTANVGRGKKKFRSSVLGRESAVKGLSETPLGVWVRNEEEGGMGGRERGKEG